MKKDILKYQFTKVKARGRTKLRTEVTCPDCGRTRWVNKSDISSSKNWTEKCKYCSDNKLRISGKGHPKWNGGRFTNYYGYVYVVIDKNDPFYCMATKQGYILEHRYVVAERLNRPLEKWEIIHHLNGIKDDNREENLELVNSNVEHYLITMMEKRIRGLEFEIKRLKGKNA